MRSSRAARLLAVLLPCSASSSDPHSELHRVWRACSSLQAEREAEEADEVVQRETLSLEISQLKSFVEDAVRAAAAAAEARAAAAAAGGAGGPDDDAPE